MAGGGASKSSNGPRVRKRVEVESASAATASLKRAKDGSAFARCEECNKDVPIALISFHNCSLDAKIKLNLEAQAVENPTEAKTKTAPKKEKSTEPQTKKEKKAKKAKNPNTPKRPPTAFFIFMDEFRKIFKAANPDCKSVATVAKEGGEKWKSLSDEEKKPYQEKAADLKAEYEKALKSSADKPNDEDEVPEKEVKEETEDDLAEKEVKEENGDDLPEKEDLEIDEE